MKYRWCIFVLGPRSIWGGKLHPGDVLAEGWAPWRWLARWQLLGLYRHLNREVCGFELQLNGAPIEHCAPLQRSAIAERRA